MQGYKQVVFTDGNNFSDSSLSSSGWSSIDIIMVILLIILVGIIVFYLPTIPASVSKAQETFALKREKFSHKKEIVYIYMNGCPYCVKFDDTHKTLKTDIDITKTFTVKEKIDIKSAEAEKYRKYGCNGFPCYLVMDGDKVVKQGSGYKSLDDFKAWLSSIF
jgi:thioredoxin-related protein